MWQRINTIAGYVIALVISVFIVFVVLEVLLRVLPSRVTVPLMTFFPVQSLYTSRWSLPHRIFSPNSGSTLHYDFGDLVSSKQDVAIDHEPRTLRYSIDSYGFRNNHDYRSGDLIVVGDSYIAGDANDQQDMLVSQLESRGLPSYAVAFPGGDPADYLINLNQFYPKLRGSKVVVFFFEGNDFPPHLNAWDQSSLLERIRKRLVRSVGDLYSVRFAYISYVRLRYALLGHAPEKSIVEIIAGKRVGFSPGYVAAAKAQNYSPPRNFLELYHANKDKISAIVFIPEKYRVYADIGAVPETLPLPNAQWDFLQQLGRGANIPVYNLTAPLETAAKDAVSKGGLLWWKDDTHWNRDGIAVAATELKKIVPDLAVPLAQAGTR